VSHNLCNAVAGVVDETKRVDGLSSSRRGTVARGPGPVSVDPTCRVKYIRETGWKAPSERLRRVELPADLTAKCAISQP